MLVAATVVGGTVQFLLVRGRARSAILSLLARVGLRPAIVDRGAGRFRGGGATTVALARMTPGVRIVAIASSAIAGVTTTSFLTGLIVGNGLFLTGHFLLGLIVGEPAVQLVAGAGAVLVAAGIVLATIGALGWWLIAGHRARSRPATVEAKATERLAGLEWSDACCPACLALAVIAPAGSLADAARGRRDPARSGGAWLAGPRTAPFRTKSGSAVRIDRKRRRPQRKAGSALEVLMKRAIATAAVSLSLFSALAACSPSPTPVPSLAPVPSVAPSVAPSSAAPSVAPSVAPSAAPSAS